MAATDTQPGEIRELLDERWAIIEQLLAGEATTHELTAYLEPSRRTIKRGLDDLVDYGLVAREKNAHRLTHFGRMGAKMQCNYMRQMGTTLKAAPLLERLPPGTEIGCEMMDSVEVAIEPELAPEAAWEPVHRAVDSADRVRGFAPKVSRSYVSTFYEQVVEENTGVELVLPEDVLAAIVANYDHEWRSAITADNCWFGSAESDVPPFGLIIIDQSEVWVGVYRDSGNALAGTLRNDTGSAVGWAVELFNRYREDATDVIPLNA